MMIPMIHADFPPFDSESALHLTSIGVGVVHAGQRSLVDPHWDRRLSHLSLGWRERRPQDQRG
jgi:hypothetical protein